MSFPGSGMAYAKAVITALLASILLGAVTGAAEVFTGALSRLGAEDKAVVYSMGVSVAMNNAAFFVLLLVPLSVVLVVLLRRRRRSTSGDAGR